MPDYTLIQLCMLLIWKCGVKLVELVEEDWVRVSSSKNSFGVLYRWGSDLIVFSMSKSIGMPIFMLSSLNARLL